MTKTKSYTDMGVPADYTELYENYYGYMKGLVRKMISVTEDEVDDLAMEILTKFIERDFLAKYDPNYDSGDGKTYSTPIPFQSFLTAFVKTYMMGMRDAVYRRKTRFRLVLDQPLQYEDEATYGDHIAVEDSFENETVDRLHLRHRLAEIGREVGKLPAKGTIKYADAYSVFCEAVLNDETTFLRSFSPIMRRKYGISDSAASTWKIKIVKAVTEVTADISA